MQLLSGFVISIVMMQSLDDVIRTYNILCRRQTSEYYPFSCMLTGIGAPQPKHMLPCLRLLHGFLNNLVLLKPHVSTTILLLAWAPTVRYGSHHFCFADYTINHQRYHPLYTLGLLWMATMDPESTMRRTSKRKIFSYQIRIQHHLSFNVKSGMICLHCRWQDRCFAVQDEFIYRASVSCESAFGISSIDFVQFI